MGRQPSDRLAEALEALGDRLRETCRAFAEVVRAQPEQPAATSVAPPSAQPAYISPGPKTRAQSLLTIKQFAETHPAFPEKRLRWMIYNGASNGLDRVAIRVAGRILIDTQKFEEWLEAQAREHPVGRRATS